LSFTLIFAVHLFTLAETLATILIPDISGFTEFITSTELEHGAHVINLLIDAIVKEVGDEYEVTEIEGDAVLLIRKGPAPTQEEIENICLRIFNAFHFQRQFLQKHTICPCGACQGVINLTLKFVAHHGPLAEITVGRFVKQSGPAMIVAHRLLKNSINNHEYLLVTDKLLNQVTDTLDPIEMAWTRSSEEYASIGTVDYHFALLNQARKKVPQPPAPPDYTYKETDNNEEISIGANFRDVYTVIFNVEGRVGWLPGLQKVEQDQPDVFIGSIHYCVFENCRVTVSPLNVTFSDEGIMYAEGWEIPEMNLHLNLEFVFRRVDEKNCRLAWRFVNAAATEITADQKQFFFARMKTAVDELKTFCENLPA
jgi:class 3 adenylate cyclase